MKSAWPLHCLFASSFNRFSRLLEMLWGKSQQRLMPVNVVNMPSALTSITQCSKLVVKIDRLSLKLTLRAQTQALIRMICL